MLFAFWNCETDNGQLNSPKSFPFSSYISSTKYRTWLCWLSCVRRSTLCEVWPETILAFKNSPVKLQVSCCLKKLFKKTLHRELRIQSYKYETNLILKERKKVQTHFSLWTILANVTLLPVSGLTVKRFCLAEDHSGLCQHRHRSRRIRTLRRVRNSLARTPAPCKVCLWSRDALKTPSKPESLWRSKYSPRLLGMH